MRINLPTHPILPVMVLLLFTILGIPGQIAAQTKNRPSSQEIATAAMDAGTDTSALFLDGVLAVWRYSGEGKYFNYVQQRIDLLLKKNGLTIQHGTTLVALFQVTGQEKYLKAAEALWQEAQGQPSTLQEQPFYAAYAALSHNDKALAQVVEEFQRREPKQGQSVSESDHYGQTLVDVLDYIPEMQPGRSSLLQLLNKWAAAKKRDDLSELQEYTLAKAVRKGYMPRSYPEAVRKGPDKVPRKYSILFVAVEADIANLPKSGLGDHVLLDSYFNNEMKKDQNGHPLSWHYKWEEQSNGGFSAWAGLFENTGFRLKTLPAAPTAANLRSAGMYIIVDPDIEKENKEAKFIRAEHIKTIRDWVKAGGVLVLMANDTGNVELDHFNQLATTFGITFKKESKGKVTGNQFEMAKLLVPAGNGIFKTAKQLYIKEYSSLKLIGPAKSVIRDKDGDHVMAIAKYGKGTVFAVGDPWLYNEYVDGRKLPPDYENFKAARELIYWLAAQVK